MYLQNMSLLWPALIPTVRKLISLMWHAMVKDPVVFCLQMSHVGLVSYLILSITLGMKHKLAESWRGKGHESARCDGTTAWP